MQISLRVKLDDARNAVVLELEGSGGPKAKSIKLGPIARGQPPVEIDVDAGGYVTAIVVPGMQEIIAEIQEEAAADSAAG